MLKHGDLEKRWAELSHELAHHEISEAEMTTLEEFAKQIRSDLEICREDYESRRLVIERLKIEAIFCIEDEQRVIYVIGKITETAQRLALASNTTCGIIGKL